jgi:chromatin structure-remodeling complex subunit RSC1/2
MEGSGHSYGLPNTRPPPPPTHPSYNAPHNAQQYHQNPAPGTPVYHQYGQRGAPFTAQTHPGAFASPSTSSQQDHYSAQSRYGPQQYAATRVGGLPGADGVAKRPDEVFHLSETANAAIPADIREQFQRDEQGRVLFFTTPPLDVLPPSKNGDPPAHSLKYIAAKLRRQREQRLKCEDIEKLPEEEIRRLARENKAKRVKRETDQQFGKQDVEALTEKAWGVYAEQLDTANSADLKQVYGDRWQEVKEILRIRLEQDQAEAKVARERDEAFQRQCEAKKKLVIRNTFWEPHLDDLNPRY